MKIRGGFTTTILLCLMGAAWAQETTGQLEGHILDEQDKAISAVNIVVTSPRLQGERGTSYQPGRLIPAYRLAARPLHGKDFSHCLPFRLGAKGAGSPGKNHLARGDSFATTSH